MKQVKPFSLLIKPASAACNLNCGYCFYKNNPDYGGINTKASVSEGTLRKIISEYMKIPMGRYSFLWQGGEPALMGIDFYKTALEIQREFAPANSYIENSIQTNATLIDRATAEFFARNKFLVGVSLDGPRKHHDRFRITAGGEPTHRDVLRGIDFLRGAGAEFNILALVNSDNVKNPAGLYKYFREKKFRYLQFIPCVDFNSDGSLSGYSITGPQWGEFLMGIFEPWYRKDVGKISVRLFDSIINYLLTGIHTDCSLDSDCRQYFAVEYDGNIFPCDFFIKKELCLGNVDTTSMTEALKSRVYREFGERKSVSSRKCSSCKWLPLCNGDCPRTRKQESNGESLSVLCEGWEMFFSRTIERFGYLAESLRNNN